MNAGTTKVYPCTAAASHQTSALKARILGLFFLATPVNPRGSPRQLRCPANQTRTTDDVAAFSAQHLEQFDAIVLNNTTSLEKAMTDRQKQAILDFVQGGKGLIGIHGATDNFKTWPDGAEMIGAIFNDHPWGAGSTVNILVEDPDHPINRAFQGCDFTIQDEIYQFREPYSRKDLEEIATIRLWIDGGANYATMPDPESFPGKFCWTWPRGSDTAVGPVVMEEKSEAAPAPWVDSTSR